MKKYRSNKYNFKDLDGKYTRITLKNLLKNNGILTLYLILVPIMVFMIIGIIYIIPTWFLYHAIHAKVVRDLITLSYMCIILFLPMSTIYLGIEMGIKKISIFKKKGNNLLSIIVPIILILTILLLIINPIISIIIIGFMCYMYLYNIAKRYYSI